MRRLRDIHSKLPKSPERTKVARMITFLKWTENASDDLCRAKAPKPTSKPS